MGTNHDPTNTNLFHVPIYIGNLSYNLCIYVNNLNTKGTHALMVVPIPKDVEHQIGMVDITTPAMKKFRKEIVDISIRESLCLYGINGINGSVKNQLEVHKIGNYNISIAQDRNQLLDSVNWQIFNKPFDFDKRISVFDDEKLYPFDCCYVVAQATKNIKDDGFGIVYKNKNIDYIPTAHELVDNDIHEYDVECYHLSIQKEPIIDLSTFKNKRQVGGIDEWGGYADDSLKKTLHEMIIKNNVNSEGKPTTNGIYTKKHNKLNVNAMCDSIRFHPVKMEDGTILKIYIPKIECITYFKINGLFSNANIFIPNERVDINEAINESVDESIHEAVGEVVDEAVGEVVDEAVDEVVDDAVDETTNKEIRCKNSRCVIA
jgi:hypothetical protein